MHLLPDHYYSCRVCLSYSLPAKDIFFTRHCDVAFLQKYENWLPLSKSTIKKIEEIHNQISAWLVP